MVQRIISFDEATCQVVVYVEGLAPYAVDLPINEDGSTLEGDDLEQYLRGFYPSQYFDRKEKLKNGIKNAESVRAKVRPLPPTELSDEQLANEARLQRSILLAQSDWTQLSDVQFSSVLADAWRSYRQALRDITLQTGFPKEIQWPLDPREEPR